MNSPRVRRLSLTLALAVFVVYSVVQTPLSVLWPDTAEGARDQLATMLIGTFFMALNVPLSLPFAEAIRTGRRRALALTGWTAAMVALQFVAIGAQIAAQHAFFMQASPLTFASLLPVAIVMDSFTAAGLLLGVVAIAHHDAAVREAGRADQVRALAHDEEMRALVAQLHPHFLFNTLTAIAALMRHDPAAARETLQQLRTLIAQHIESTEPYWSVGEEMLVITTYLDIEKRRFGDRLQVHIDAAGDVTAVRLPRLLLQPIVENAVRHGTRRGGAVSVRVVRDGAMLNLEVADTGTFGLTAAHGTGVGLPNIRARLDLLYGRNHTFAIESGSAGTRVKLSLPAQTAA